MLQKSLKQGLQQCQSLPFLRYSLLFSIVFDEFKFYCFILWTIFSIISNETHIPCNFLVAKCTQGSWERCLDWLCSCSKEIFGWFSGGEFLQTSLPRCYPSRASFSQAIINWRIRAFANKLLLSDPCLSCSLKYALLARNLQAFAHVVTNYVTCFHWFLLPEPGDNGWRQEVHVPKGHSWCWISQWVES